MSLVINHNLMAMVAPRGLNTAYGRLATSTRRTALSSPEQGGSAAAQPSGESLAAGTAEQASGALLNTSDAAAGTPQAAQGKIADLVSQEALAPKGLTSQPPSGSGLQTALTMGLFKPDMSALTNLLKG